MIDWRTKACFFFSVRMYVVWAFLYIRKSSFFSLCVTYDDLEFLTGKQTVKVNIIKSMGKTFLFGKMKETFFHFPTSIFRMEIFFLHLMRFTIFLSLFVWPSTVWRGIFFFSAAFITRRWNVSHVKLIELEKSARFVPGCRKKKNFVFLKSSYWNSNETISLYWENHQKCLGSWFRIYIWWFSAIQTKIFQRIHRL